MLDRVILVRHGETAWSLSGQHTGLSDLALTAHGEEQARMLRTDLQSLKFSAVLTSPLERARRTSELAGFVQATSEPLLVEWSYGEYEGRTSAQIREERPDWNLYTDGARGGEMPQQVVVRVDALIAKLRSMSGTVAVFSHGHLLRVLAVRWIELPIVQASRLQLDTASISILGFDRHNSDTPTLITWNRASSSV